MTPSRAVHTSLTRQFVGLNAANVANPTHASVVGGIGGGLTASAAGYGRIVHANRGPGERHRLYHLGTRSRMPYATSAHSPH